MKSKFETLKDVVKYVMNESEDPVSELLMMGFTPCQLVFEFGFSEDAVKNSEVYEESKDAAEGEDLDYSEYPFVLDNYSPFDAAVVSRFELSKDALLELKDTDLYEEIKGEYEGEKIEALTDVLNEVFDKYEDKMLELLDSLA